MTWGTLKTKKLVVGGFLLIYIMFIQGEVILHGCKYLSRRICFISLFCEQWHDLSKINRTSTVKYPFSTYLKPKNVHLHTTKIHLLKEKDIMPTKEEIAPREHYFKQMEVKNKSTYLQLIDVYNAQDKIKRGHIEFIYAALKCMEEYGIIADLEAYKKLMDVFPKGKMIPKNLIQAEFYHFPRHQECGVTLLDQMEYYGVCPDKEMGDIIRASFGVSSHVYKKYCRMMYWMPKLKNINPYLLPDPLPSDIRVLARLALKKMSVDTRTKIVEYDATELEDSRDKTWIMSAQSPVQQKYIQEHSEEKAIYVEGPFLVWLRKLSMTYFILRADPKIYPVLDQDDDDVSDLKLWMFGDPKPVELALRPASVHEQEEGIILAMCCTGTSSKDSLLSWIRFLQKSNPKLENIPVLFTLRSSPVSVIAVNISEESASEISKENNEEQIDKT